MYVKVNGTRLFFDVVGSRLQPIGEEMKPKPVVIALHGGPGYDHSYLRSLDPLGEVAQVVYLDLRGQGRSARHHKEYGCVAKTSPGTPWTCSLSSCWA